MLIICSSLLDRFMSDNTGKSRTPCTGIFCTLLGKSNIINLKQAQTGILSQLVLMVKSE